MPSCLKLQQQQAAADWEMEDDVGRVKSGGSGMLKSEIYPRPKSLFS